VGTALLGVPEWEQRQPLPGDLLSTRMVSHRGRRSDSYAIELHTTQTSVEWAQRDSYRPSRQSLADAIERFIDSPQTRLELHEPLNTSDLVLITLLLAVPFFLGLLIRIEQLTLDTDARTVRFLYRGMWQHEDKTFALADLHEMRIDQKKGNRNQITCSLVLPFADGDSITIQNVNNKQAQAAKGRIEEFFEIRD
jgi:hypothetical protein